MRAPKVMKKAEKYYGRQRNSKADIAILKKQWKRWKKQTIHRWNSAWKKSWEIF